MSVQICDRCFYLHERGVQREPMHDTVESEHYQEVICSLCRLKKQEWFVDDKGGKDMSYKCTYEHPQNLPDLI